MVEEVIEELKPKLRLELDSKDKELLQLMQDDFPLESHPYAVLANKLGLTEDEVFARVKRLYAEGVIRKLRTILDAQKLGTCSSTLIAMKAVSYTHLTLPTN